MLVVVEVVVGADGDAGANDSSDGIDAVCVMTVSYWDRYGKVPMSRPGQRVC